jgi:hypothetical protein
MMSKKGQGLSLNVIIVAALALIVLVVLIVVFTGRLAIFEREVGAEGDTELVKMRIKYGDCQPTEAEEQRFRDDYLLADTSVGKADAKDVFNTQIRECKSLSTADSCGSSGQCTWNP